jgi:hypothetical protein
VTDDLRGVLLDFYLVLKRHTERLSTLELRLERRERHLGIETDGAPPAPDTVAARLDRLERRA